MSISRSTPLTMQLAISGSITESYNESEITTELPTITGYGGYMRRTGSIFQPVKWKGIDLPALMTSLVGQIDYNISIISVDGYRVNLTASEVEGEIRTFDEENTTLSIKAIPCLAYEQDDAALNSEDGPLRLVFIGENNQSVLTFGPLWVGQVITVFIETTDEITSIPTSTTPHESETSTQNRKALDISKAKFQKTIVSLVKENMRFLLFYLI
ncbi:MAG: hypothetical protein ACW964_10900 [Candidatus Hodarchaeales archaeon]